MFKRILVPLDGSPRAEEALAWARALAARSGAQLLLMHVEQPFAAVMDQIAIDNRLEALADELRRGGIKAHIVTEFGKVASAITASAILDDVDLIALAPEPRNFIEMLRRPSVTASVLARTAAPVLIAPAMGGAAAPKMLEFGGAQVIVPLDGSPLAEKALPLALRLARVYDRSLLLFRVLPPTPIIAAGPETYPLVRDASESELKEAREYLSALRERLERSENVAVQTTLHRGIPAEVILAFTETKPGSILVMSTHGRTGLARIVMGSVALAVARKISIPLMIVPTAPPEQNRRPDATHVTHDGRLDGVTSR